MRSGLVVGMLLLVSLSPLFLTFSETAEAATIIVEADGSGGFTTIAAGIAAASPGDTIMIGPGTYDGGFDVDRSLDIIGAGQGVTIIEDFANDPVVTVSGSDILIQDLSVMSDDDNSPTAFTISGDNVTLESLAVSHVYEVVYNDNINHNLTVANSTFSHLHGYGFEIYDATDVVIRGNNFREIGTAGIYIEPATRITVEDNSFHHTGDTGAMEIYDSFSVNVMNNSIHQGSVGYLDGGQYHNFSSNWINTGVLSSPYSAYFGADDQFVLNNTFITSHDLQFGRASRITIENNTLTNGSPILDAGSQVELESYSIANNTVGGGPYYFYVNRSNESVPSDAAGLGIYYSENITATGLDLVSFGMLEGKDNTISSSILRGIRNQISGPNRITANTIHGRLLHSNPADTMIDNNTFTDTTEGVISAANPIHIVNNTFADRSSTAVDAVDLQGSGPFTLVNNTGEIRVYASNDLLAVDNQIQHLTTRFNAVPTVLDNVFSDGLWIAESARDGEYRNNSLGGAGLELNDEDLSNIILDNITYNGGEVYFGDATPSQVVPTTATQVVLSGSDDAVIDGLTLAGPENPIVIRSATGVQILNTTISGGAEAVYGFNVPDLVVNNTFIDGAVDGFTANTGLTGWTITNTTFTAGTGTPINAATGLVLENSSVDQFFDIGANSRIINNTLVGGIRALSGPVEFAWNTGTDLDLTLVAAAVVHNNTLVDVSLQSAGSSAQVFDNNSITDSPNAFSTTDGANKVYQNNTIVDSSMSIAAANADQIMFSGNSVNGLPLVVVWNQDNMTVAPGAGGVLVVDSENITVSDQNLSFVSAVNSVDLVLSDNNVSTSGTGFWIQSSPNLVASGNNISGAADSGVLLSLQSSPGSVVVNNTLTGGDTGLFLQSSDGSRAENNSVSGLGTGIWITGANLVIRNNSITTPGWGVSIQASTAWTLENNQISGLGSHFFITSQGPTLPPDGNTLNGQPLYYYEGVDNITVPTDAGQVFVFNSDNVTMDGLQMSAPIRVEDSKQVIVSNSQSSFNRGSGFYNTEGLQLIGNTFSDNGAGVETYGSHGAIITGNTFSNTNDYGAYIGGHNSIVTGNTASNNNWSGIALDGADDVVFDDNWLYDNQEAGLTLWGANSLRASGNVITNNIGSGVEMDPAWDLVFTNNWVENNGAPALSNSDWEVFVPDASNNWWGQSGPDFNITHYEADLDPQTLVEPTLISFSAPAPLSTLSGNATFSAQMDRAQGIMFEISDDQTNWNSFGIGSDLGGGQYDMVLNTTMYVSGTYWMRALGLDDAGRFQSSTIQFDIGNTMASISGPVMFGVLGGGMNSVDLSVSNLIGTNHSVNFGLSGPAAAWSSLSMAQVDLNGTEMLTLTGSPPGNTMANLYIATVSVFNGAGTIATHDVTIRVWHNDMITATGPAMVSGNPGDSVSVDVVIENTGNGSSDLTFAPSGSIVAWATLNNTGATLAPGETAMVRVSVDIPTSAILNDYILDLDASNGTGVIVSHTVTVSVVAPPLADVRLVGDVTASIEQGVTQLLTLTVSNIGNAPGDANVSITGGTASGWASITLGSSGTIPAAGSRPVTISVAVPEDAVAGDYTLVVTPEQDGMVVTGQVLTITITVTEPVEDDDDDSQASTAEQNLGLGIMGGAAFLLLIVLILIFQSMRQHKKQEEAVKEEESVYDPSSFGFL